MPRDPKIGPVEAELQDHVGAGDGKRAAGGAESVSPSSTALISSQNI